MFYDGDKIAILFYAISRTKTESGEYKFKRFPSLSHIIHEVFLFAQGANYLKAYEFKAGKYMPQSDIIDEGIKKYFVWNPIFDEYEYNGEWDLLLQAEEFLQKIPDYERNEIIRIRAKCENYTASELYLLLHKSELSYINNRTIDNSMNAKIGAILSKLYWDNLDETYRTETISEEVYNKLMESFKIQYH